MIPPAEIVIRPDTATLAQEAARRFAAAAEKTVAARGRFTVALSGGATPVALYRLLAGEPYRTHLPWTEIHLFWADERCVPPEDPNSNYRLLAETLLASAPVPPQNIHRIRGEWEPERAANDYEQRLRAFFGDGSPRLDLVLLGLGTDGHTASLFPEAATLTETTRLALPVGAAYKDRPAWRVTLTLPLLNAARGILFLVSGADKARIVHKVLEDMDARLPAQYIRPTEGEVTWLLDAASAALLPEEAHSHKQRPAS